MKVFCRECNGESKGGWNYDCLTVDCVLYPWKEGKGVYELGTTIPETHKQYIAELKEPVRKTRKGRVMTEEHKAKLKEAKKAYWEKKKHEVPNTSELQLDK